MAADKSDQREGVTLYLLLAPTFPFRKFRLGLFLRLLIDDGLIVRHVVRSLQLQVFPDFLGDKIACYL